MSRVRPSLRSTETYTETNFLRLETAAADDADYLVTLEHFSSGNGSAWSCRTIIDAEKMTRADAVFIARNYARENGIPVVYECLVEGDREFA
jgi:hypothetical protein